jgi:small subunit ribosomal protein S1
MTNETAPQTPSPVVDATEPAAEPGESFGELLSQFEKSHTHAAPAGQKQLQGTVVSVTADQVILDVGYKIEGVLPRAAFENNADAVKPGDSFPVSITGRNEEGYYELSRFRVAQPRDWTGLEQAFAQKLAVAGTVTGVVKGGLTVDIGVRAFMPASRSGTREAAEMEALVGTEITCRITKLDVADEDVVVDRRVVLEEQARALLQQRHAAMQEGDVVTGHVRSLMSYGAFIDLGGVDGLLHVSDISFTRIAHPQEILTVGQQLEVKILKIDPETKKISLGLKQLQPQPWQTAAERYAVGQRVTGTVTRLTDFGAFVEVEPGIEGLIHISEMSWGKKVRHPGDILKAGDAVDAQVLAIKLEERRLSLGLKQALGDPWADGPRKFPVGSQVEGPVTKLMNFGAFVQIAEGIEGLVHVSEISAERRINHPRDVLHAGQRVKALVLAIDAEKRQVKLSMKQLVPTSIDEYIAEHKPGDVVSGRVIEVSANEAIVELGEGIRASCRNTPGSIAAAPAEIKPAAKSDLSSLSAMLKARWKGDSRVDSEKPESLAPGQIRSFKIAKIKAETKYIEVGLHGSQ